MHKLSQPNNNHNSNDKTTKTVVGLRLSNRWEPLPPQELKTTLGPQKAKNEPKIKSELKDLWKLKVVTLSRPKNRFCTYPDLKNSPLGPQVKSDPKLRQIQKLELKKI